MFLPLIHHSVTHYVGTDCHGVMPQWLILTNRLALSRVSGDKNLAVGEAKRNPRSGPRHSVCAGREAKAERHGRRLFTAYQSMRHYH